MYDQARTDKHTPTVSHYQFYPSTLIKISSPLIFLNIFNIEVIKLLQEIKDK